jgi:arginine exporter protein ArgO
MGTGAALASGVVAGLGVAMPLGAVGVLLVQEGASRGARRALSGAAAVASVDALYCALALLVGGVATPRLTAWRPWPALVGGVALLVVAGVGLRRGLARRDGEAPDEATGLRRGPAEARDATPAALRRYALFFGLTAVNPATLVSFTALASGLALLTDRPTTAGAFVAGVGAASFGWQALLVVVGGLLGGRAGPRVRRATTVVGNAVVALLGVVMLWRAMHPW